MFKFHQIRYSEGFWVKGSPFLSSKFWRSFSLEDKTEITKRKNINKTDRHSTGPYLSVDSLAMLPYLSVDSLAMHPNLSVDCLSMHPNLTVDSLAMLPNLTINSDP